MRGGQESGSSTFFQSRVTWSAFWNARTWCAPACNTSQLFENIWQVLSLSFFQLLVWNYVATENRYQSFHSVRDIQRLSHFSQHTRSTSVGARKSSENCEVLQGDYAMSRSGCEVPKKQNGAGLKLHKVEKNSVVTLIHLSGGSKLASNYMDMCCICWNVIWR